MRWHMRRLNLSLPSSHTYTVRWQPAAMRIIQTRGFTLESHNREAAGRTLRSRLSRDTGLQGWRGPHMAIHHRCKCLMSRTPVEIGTLYLAAGQRSGWPQRSDARCPRAPCSRGSARGCGTAQSAAPRPGPRPAIAHSVGSHQCTHITVHAALTTCQRQADAC